MADKDSDLVKDFMLHLVTGGIMFLMAAAVSVGLELTADYLDDFPKLWVLAIVFHLVGYVDSGLRCRQSGLFLGDPRI